jgi:5-methylthioadenosine/S-adenosylhomocysteine deaminase
MSAKTLISDAVLVNPTVPPEIIDPGWLVMAGDRIEETGIATPPDRVVRSSDRHVHAEGGILLPGLVNTHNHASMTLFRGLADDLPLMTWLEGTIFPTEARVVDEDFVYWGTLLACAEMILSGTTTFANGYFFEMRAVEAVRHARIRAVASQGIVDFPTPDLQDPTENVAQAIRFVESSPDTDMFKSGIFCHSPYTCSPETLVKAKAYCRENRILYFIHVSETQWEVDEIKNRYGTTPVRHLNQLNLLDEMTVVIHGVWVDEAEIEILAKRNTGVVVCTESHMKLASGIAPLPDYLQSGVRVALGTDGAASNNDLDLFGEMATTARLHKVRRADPTILDAAVILNLATEGGARLLGWDDVGLLQPGYRADVILLKTNRPHLQPLYNAVSQLVYSARGADVDTVWIAGRPVLEERKLLTIDEGDLYQNIARLREKIHKPRSIRR